MTWLSKLCTVCAISSLTVAKNQFSSVGSEVVVIQKLLHVHLVTWYTSVGRSALLMPSLLVYFLIV